MDALRLYLLGSPRLERNGQLVEMDTRKALALLAVLALSGQDQQRDSLAALLYPEAEPASARAAFRRTLSTLNVALGEGLLAIRREAVGLAPGGGVRVDVLQFLSLLKTARQAQGQAGLAPLEQAANLYRDDFMAGFSLRDSPAFDEWQYQQAEDLRRQLTSCLDQLAALFSSAGEYPRAIQYAARRASVDPLLEEGHRQLMILYARAGQRSAALRQYRECVRILEQELGVGPLAETERLYQEILSSSLESAAGALDSANLPRESVAAAPLPAESAFLPSPHPQLEQATATTALSAPLVGREIEVERLCSGLQTAATGLLISLEGEAGVGKTRLAQEILALAHAEGRAILQASCYEGESGLAYGPLLTALGPAAGQPSAAQRIADLPPEVLSEGGRLLPGLRAGLRQDSFETLPEGPGAQVRFFEALRQLIACLLAGARPGILFIDDLHWADAATLDLLGYLARRTAPGSFHLLVTWRSHTGPHSERLRQLQANQKRSGHGLHLELQRLSEAQTSALARSLFAAKGAASLTAEQSARLYQESEGLPFIAVEYLRSLQAGAGDWQLPGGVRDLLHQRLQAPGELARQLLTAAAVIGRSFDFATLQNVSGRSELEVINGLEELVGLGLLWEGKESDYDFSHEKLRQVAYDETSQVRRRLLHLRVGEALPPHKAGLAAGHLLKAGQAGRAADLFRQAGDQARSLFANDEALSAYQSALAAGHPDPAGLHEACGDLFTLMGHYAEAIASYQAAAAFCSQSCLSNLMHKLGEVYQRRGEWDAAEGHYQAALDTAGAGGSPAWLAHLYADWGLTAYRRKRFEPARRLADLAMQQAQSAGDPSALAQAFNVLGILARASGRLDEAGHFLQSSLEAAGRAGEPRLRCAVLNNLARLLQERGQPTEAIPLAREALQLCARLGDRHRQAAIQNTLADLYHQAGQGTQSMAELKQAIALFAEISEEAPQSYPEIWKMTEW